MILWYPNPGAKSNYLCYFQGHDTTAAGLTWALYLLARHPHVQQQVHEEVDKFFGECLVYDVQGHFARSRFSRFVLVLFTLEQQSAN